MPPAALKGFRVCTIGLWRASWTAESLQRWISEAGGQYEKRLSEDTTHVVVTEKEWAAQGPSVTAAMRTKQTERPELQIVNFDWLDDCLSQRIRQSEKPYEWAMAKEEEEKRADIEKSKVNDEPGNAEREVRSAAGLMKEAFCNSTDQYIDRNALRRLDKRREEERRIQHVEDEGRMQDLDEQLRARGADNPTTKVNGIEVLSTKLLKETHKIATDATNFAFDIALVREDIISGHVERVHLALQIWQSLKEPHTYIVIIDLAPTQSRPSRSKVIALGCPWLTAFRAFRKVFFELTGDTWGDRQHTVFDDGPSPQRQERRFVYHSRLAVSVPPATSKKDTVSVTGLENGNASGQGLDSSIHDFSGSDRIQWGSPDIEDGGDLE